MRRAAACGLPFFFVGRGQKAGRSCFCVPFFAEIGLGTQIGGKFMILRPFFAKNWRRGTLNRDKSAQKRTSPLKTSLKRYAKPLEKGPKTYPRRSGTQNNSNQPHPHKKTPGAFPGVDQVCYLYSGAVCSASHSFSSSVKPGEIISYTLAWYAFRVSSWPSVRRSGMMDSLS